MRELLIVLLLLLCLCGISGIIDNNAGKAAVDFFAIAVTVVYITKKLVLETAHRDDNYYHTKSKNAGKTAP